MEPVQFNVGGRLFATHRSTLKAFEGNLLSTMIESAVPSSRIGDAIFIDRDPDLFVQVLKVLRGSSVELTDELLEELDYYGLQVKLPNLVQEAYDYILQIEQRQSGPMIGKDGFFSREDLKHYVLDDRSTAEEKRRLVAHTVVAYSKRGKIYAIDCTIPGAKSLERVLGSQKLTASLVRYRKLFMFYKGTVKMWYIH